MAFVYRIYDAGDRLLYVGMSARSAKRRIGQHMQKPWGEAIERWRIDSYATATEAREAEAKAIFAERPLHNVDHVFGSPEGREAWTEADWRHYFTHMRDLGATRDDPHIELAWIEFAQRFRRPHVLPPVRLGNQWSGYTAVPFVGAEVI
jgi:Uri superfamily endonuclease